MPEPTQTALHLRPDEPRPDLSPGEAPLPVAHLERDLKLIQRYAFIHSNVPFKSNNPLLGGLIVAMKGTARAGLRRALAWSIGTQAEFNAAVANILFEFTRRAASPAPLTLNESALDDAQRHAASTDPHEHAEAVELLAREIQLLGEQVRAAQLTASENERLVSELRREIEILKQGQRRNR
jgi:hypothetical protein